MFKKARAQTGVMSLCGDYRVGRVSLMRCFLMLRSRKERFTSLENMVKRMKSMKKFLAH